MIPVKYNKDEPELMAQFEEHWDKGVTYSRNERVKTRILREWKAGNCKILIPEEVYECLSKICQSKSS